MNSLKQLLPRDPPDFVDNDTFGPGMGSLAFIFFTLVLVASALALALICLRRKKMARQRYNESLLPSYHNHSAHHRSASMTNIPTIGRNDSIFVYDEKMNLIANSSSPPSSAVPEIRLTFPDDEGNAGQQQTGRVVVVHVTDTGSIGMAPLNHEPLPPYQRSDADRFQSLDLDRIGGLREKEPLTQRSA
jgi:hypothetical protein